MEFGLVGRNIGYSFSPEFFKDKFRKLNLKHHYSLFDIEDIQEILKLFELPNLKGLNVTIPYKISVIPYLDELSEEAKAIGAVNCISLTNGKKIGYNTDCFGFEKSLEALNRNLKNAIILGDGGAAQAVKFVLNQRNIPFKTYTRSGENKLDELNVLEVKNTELIVQTTPVGTFPNQDDCLDFPFEALNASHSVIDLIYKPSKSKFLQKSIEKDVNYLNGRQMLVNQAEKAWEIWTFT